MAPDPNIWHSRIYLGIKLRLYNSCILPIFLYDTETRAVIVTAVKTFDVLDHWCWSQWITNNEVRSRTHQPPLSDTVRARRLRSFGHVSRADSTRVTCRHYGPVSQACQWKGRGDLASHDRHGYNLWSYARSILAWRLFIGVHWTEQLVQMATSMTSLRWWWNHPFPHTHIVLVPIVLLEKFFRSSIHPHNLPSQSTIMKCFRQRQNKTLLLLTAFHSIRATLICVCQLHIYHRSSIRFLYNRPATCTH